MNAGNEEALLNGVLLGLETYFESAWIHQIRMAIRKFPDARIADAMSKQQVLSKKWAVEKIHSALGPDPGMVFLIGGWYGTLAAMMFESGLFANLQIRSFDIDPSCAPVADEMNRAWVVDGWRFKASTADAYLLDYSSTAYQVKRADESVADLRSDADLIVNCSCEHLGRFAEWIGRVPAGKRLVLQSNDFFESPDHVNCVRSIDEFKAQARLSEVFYEGTLEMPDYRRFMLIGAK